MSNRRLLGPGIGCVITVLSLSACAPTFQDARLLAPGAVAVTPSFSGVGISDRRSEYIGQTFGAVAEVGVHERLNVGGGIGRIDFDDTDEGLNGAGFGARVGIVKDKIAVSLPFTFAFGEHVDTSESWMFHPTVLFTIPVGARMDVNPSFRVLIPMCSDCGASDIVLGFAGGVGILVTSRVTLRPEAGLLINPGESGVVWTFGVAVSLRSR